MKALVAAAVIVGVGAIAPDAQALEPLLEDSGYRHDVWRTRDGLPSDVVRQVVQASDGYIWVATQDGVVRFDGARFRALNAVGAEELLNREVVDIWEDPEKVLWLATQGQGVYHLRDGRLVQVDARHGLTHNFARGFAPGPGRGVWVGTASGLTLLNSGRVTARVPHQEQAGDKVRAMATDRDGTLWIGTAHGLARVADGRWTKAQTGTAADRDEVRALLSEADGTLWVGLRKGGLVRLRGDLARVFGPAEGLGEDPVALLRDRRGRLWVGTSRSLQWMDGERFVTAEIQPLCDRRLTALAEDQEGGLWVSTNGCGLHRLSDRSELRVIAFQGQPSSVHGAADGTVAVGRWDGAVERLSPRREPWPAAGLGAVPQLFVESASRAWFRGASGALFRAEASSIGPFTIPEFQKFEAVHVDRRGGLWLGRADHPEVLRVSPDGSRRRFGAEDGVVLPRLFYESEDGTLWLITAGGVARFEENRFRHYAVHAQGNPYLSSLWQDDDGRLWFTSSLFGLGTLESDGRVRFFAIQQGLPTRRLFFITADGHGRVWMSGSAGVFHVERSALRALAAGRRTTLSPVLFGGAERVHMPSYQAGRQPGWRAADGTIYLVGERAVLQIDPRKRGQELGSPPTVLEELVVDDLRTALADRVELGPTRGDIAVHYAALTFEAPEQVRFRYRLEGFDDDWIDAGAGRVAYYTKVPPGTFRFRVAAWRAGQTTPGRQASFSLVLRPSFHQTGWFYGAVAVAIAAVGLALHRVRLAAARGRYEAILNERTRLSREIHDTLAQGFAAVAAQVECARDALADRPELAKQDLDRARELCRASLQEARRTIWSLRPGLIERHGLAGALEEAAAQLRVSHAVEVAIRGTPRRLPAPVEDNLLRIAQETLANAVRHAQARRLSVDLSYRAASVRLEISDDGQGLPPEAPVDGRPRLGLVGMRERATAIGAFFEIQSEPGGTRIVVEVNA